MKLLSTIAKEILEVSHDRTMLAVLVIFPIFIMLFIGSSFRSMEINGLPIGVVGPQNTTFSSMLFSGLNESTAFKLQSFDNESEAMDAFRNGQLKAVIVVPENIDESLAKGNGSTIQIFVDNSDLALEQSVLAAMTSVMQASSADITKTYVAGAWKQLGDLNSSAASLSDQVASSEQKMNQTKAKLGDIKQGMDSLNLSQLDSSLADAQSATDDLSSSLESQREALVNASISNAQFMNQTGQMLDNASSALNSSIFTVQDTHDKLAQQTANLTQTAGELQNAITGLSLIRNSTSDATMLAALDLDIASLTSLRGSVLLQIDQAKNESLELESLNSTLQNFSMTLGNYSSTLTNAESQDSTAGMVAAIDSASAKISTLNSSFSSARDEVSQLKTLMSGIGDAMTEINSTLDQAMSQADSVDGLLASLRSTVQTQTSRDPASIASPLSVEVQDQYQRSSFVDFLIPQVIAISLLFSCFLLASISFVREKTRNTVIRALLAPFGLENLVLGKIISLVLLSMAQVAIILVVAQIIFGVQPPTDIIMLLAGTCISALVLSSIGVLIGFYAKSESAAIQTCLLFAIPMLFLGNIIFSPDLLPNYTQILQELLPLAHVTNIFKIVMITGGNPTGEIAALLSYLIFLAAILALVIWKRRDIRDFQ